MARYVLILSSAAGSVCYELMPDEVAAFRCSVPMRRFPNIRIRAVCRCWDGSVEIYAKEGGTG